MTLDDVQKEIWRLNDMKKRVSLSKATKIKISERIKELRKVLRAGMKNAPAPAGYNKL